MSIVATVKVHDGIALGADSMSSIFATDPQGNVGIVKTYEHAQKLFQLDKFSGVAAYGIGNIGKRSVGSFLIEFRNQLADKLLPLKELTQQLLDFLATAYQPTFQALPQDQKPQLGMLVGGYSPNEPLSEEWEFILPVDSTPRPVREPKVFGASWRGVPHPFSRLYAGYDPGLPQLLAQAGVDPGQLKKAMPNLRPLTLPIIFDGMPLQDAVDFLCFILRTTIGAARFMAGAASCGGPLSVAIITREHEFKWIQEPQIILQ